MEGEEEGREKEAAKRLVNEISGLRGKIVPQSEDNDISNRYQVLVL